MSLNSSFVYFNPTKILCGSNALVNLPYELSQLGVDLPFVMVDGRTTSAVMKKVINTFRGSGITLALFEDVPLGPDEKQLNEMVALFCQNSCNGIIAVGKDSVVNTAKLLAITLIDPDLDPARFGGHDKLETKLMPLVQIPCGLYLDNGALPLVRAEQWYARSSFLLPDLAVLDTRLHKPADTLQSISCALLTLSIGLESVAGNLGNPMTTSLAMSMVTCVMQYFSCLFTQNIHRFEECLLAHAQMLAGSVSAGSKQTVLPLLAEELAQTCDGDKGLLTGILLPYALAILTRRHPDAVGELLMACQETEIFAITAEAFKANCTINILYELLQQLEDFTDGRIATTLENFGVPWKSLDRIAQSINYNTADMDAENEQWEVDTILELLTHAWRGIPIAMKNAALCAPKHN